MNGTGYQDYKAKHLIIDSLLCGVFTVILSLTIVNTGLAQNQSNQVETLYKAGVESAGKAGSTTNVDKNIGYLETAIRYFTEALKIEPQNIKVLLERAKTHKTLFQYEPALADCEQALEFVLKYPNPNQSELYRIYKTKGEIYEHDDDYKNAIANYYTALKYNPGDSGLTAAINRNRLLAGEDLSDEEIEQALNSSLGNLRTLPEPKNIKPQIKKFFYPKPDSFYRLGLANLKKAENAKTEKSQKHYYDLAYKNFSKSIERNPTFAESYFQRSKTYDYDDEKRLDDINKAIELKSDFADAYIERAGIWNFNEYENRLNDLSKAIELKPSDIEILLQRGEIYLELYEFEKALADCEKALQKTQVTRKSQSKSAAVYSLFGKIYEKGFYLSKAIDAYTKAIKFNPKDAEAYESRGFIYQFTGEAAKADADFSKADSLRIANKKLGMISIVGDSTALSISVPLKRRIEIPEVFQVFHFKEVGGYYDGFFGAAASNEEEQKTYQREIEKAKKIIAFNPKSELAHWKLANLHLRAKRFDDAIMGFMTLVMINNRYEYLNNMGVALAEKGRLQNAIFQFEIAIRNGNTRVEAFYNKGLCYSKNNENENAIADFTQVIKLNPNFILAYQSRAKAFRAVGKIAEAEADENKIISLKEKF